MEVTKTGAALEFDCATGTITGTLPDKGAFRLSGTFTPERGGPIRRDDVSRTVKATYSGTITADDMALSMLLAGQEDDQAAKYALVKGQPGRVTKCK